MRSVTRYWALLLILASSLVFAACVPVAPGEPATPAGEADVDTEDGAADEPVTIVFWTHTHPPMVELNEQLIQEYMDQNPNVTIEYEVIPNNQFFEQMLVSMSTGVGPDVLNMGDSHLLSDYIPRGLVSEIDPQAMGFESIDELTAEYLPNALNGAFLDGQYYGLPSEFNTNLLAINLEDLTEAGYPEDWAPATWEDLAEVAADLSEFDEEGRQTHRGFDFVYLHASWYASQFRILTQQTGCEWFNEENTESTINSPECVEALNIWKDLIYEYEAANPALSARESTVPLQDYINENVSMTVVQPWGMELIRSDNPELWENTTLVPLPQHDPGNPVNVINGYYWAVNAESDVQEEAWRFIWFLADHPGRWLQEVNFVQPRVGWAELPEAEEFPFAEQWNTALESGQFPPLVPNANEVNEALRSAMEDVLLQDADTQERLDQLKSEMDRIIQS